MIKKYNKNVFTHDGQSTVNEFGQEIIKSKDELIAVKNLIVYAGYHGDTDGEWDHDFDASEVAATKKIGELFPNATIKWIKDSGLSNNEIKNAFNNGNVFFTWCDSDTKVKKVMGI